MCSSDLPDLTPCLFFVVVVNIIYFHLYKMSRTQKSVETKSGSVVAKTGHMREWEVSANEYKVSF